MESVNQQYAPGLVEEPLTMDQESGPIGQIKSGGLPTLEDIERLSRELDTIDARLADLDKKSANGSA